MKKLILTLTLLCFGSAAAMAISGGGGNGTPCGSCEGIIIDEPENLQAQAREVQKTLESKTVKDLDILIANGNDVCSLIDCFGVSPETVASLASRVEETRFRKAADDRLDQQESLLKQQNQTSIASAVVAALAFLLSVLAFWKKKAT